MCVGGGVVGKERRRGTLSSRGTAVALALTPAEVEG